jgi:hypothetical protein
MDFCAQSAFAAPDRLGFAVFFWAPALCWWARTIVLSIMAYSLSASAAKISNIFFQSWFVRYGPFARVKCHAYQSSVQALITLSFLGLFCGW